MATDNLPLLRSEGSVLGRLSPLMRELRERGPVVKVRTRAGDEAWLVTRYAELKELLKDSRIGMSHPDPANRPRYVDSPLLDLGVADDPAVGKETHAKMRAALTPHFSAKRMAALRERIAQRVNDMLDKILAEGPPADLHADFSVPLSCDVLCELLGVSDQEQFLSLLGSIVRVDDVRDVTSKVEALYNYLVEQVTEKRAHPGEDLISALCEPGVPDEEACHLILSTSSSFLVTPSNLSAGIALFAAHPDQRDQVVQNPGLLGQAVEEVLRISKSGESFQPRYAIEDIEIAGIVIKAGDLVLCDHYSAGFDDRVFEDPERFDVTRSPNPHLAFSHGIYYCIGAPLARIEMQEAIGAVLRRLPTMRLAVPLEEVSSTDSEDMDQLGGGIARLPVIW